MNSSVETGTSLGSLVKGGVVLLAAALGVAIGGIAVWGARRWRDERAYQAWRTHRSSTAAKRPVKREPLSEHPGDHRQ